MLLSAYRHIGKKAVRDRSSHLLFGPANSSFSSSFFHPPPSNPISASSRLRQILLLLNPSAVQFSIRHSSSSPPSAPSGVPPEPIPHPVPDLFKVSDKVSLFDRKVELRVQGLPSGVKVTLHGAVEREWRREPVQFVSYAHYVTDEQGQVDLSTDASFGGTYTGNYLKATTGVMSPRGGGYSSVVRAPDS